jgi:hypothetical protein
MWRVGRGGEGGDNTTDDDDDDDEDHNNNTTINSAREREGLTMTAAIGSWRSGTLTMTDDGGDRS